MDAIQRSRIEKAVDAAQEALAERVKGTGHQIDFDWNEALRSPWKYQRQQHHLGRAVWRAEESQWCTECLRGATTSSFEDYLFLQHCAPQWASGWLYLPHTEQGQSMLNWESRSAIYTRIVFVRDLPRIGYLPS